MVNVTQRKGNEIKPQVTAKYNGQKSFINVSEDINSYNLFSERSLKWYHKVASDILLNIIVVRYVNRPGGISSKISIFGQIVYEF